MADNTGSPTKKFSIPPVALVIALVAAAGVGLFLYLERGAHMPPPPAPPLTGEAKAYVKHLRLIDVNMEAAESYLKQSVVEIRGKIGNEGDRVLQVVEINCVFYDYYGQVVLRERVPIVSRKMGNLAPGEIKNFRLPFDNIPESWNQAMPQLVIARIDFS
ncbi:MAG TPA: FxLYD domain-containing protein [Bryobacteraceae bacterium]|nr:FxLYD domain-containing protein [Bryobacteraceae bacterium]